MDVENSNSLTLQTQEIIGAPLENAFPEVCKVSIHRTFGRVSSCTGVLVTPNSVLLAAHCLATNSNSIKIIKCSFTLPNGRRVFRLSKTFQFKKGFSLKKMEEGTALSRAKGSQLDYAIVFFRNSITSILPAPILPYDVLMDRKKKNPSLQLKAVGFGKFSNKELIDSRKGGKKRSFAFDFSVYKDPGTKKDLKVFRVSPPKQLSSTGEVISTHSGDSGGPYFVNIQGVNYLVGLISSVTMKRNPKIKGDALYAVGVSTDFPIASFKNAFKGYAQDLGPLGFFYKARPRVSFPPVVSTIPSIKINKPADASIIEDTEGSIESHTIATNKWTLESYMILGGALIGAAFVFDVFTKMTRASEK